MDDKQKFYQSGMGTSLQGLMAPDDLRRMSSNITLINGDCMKAMPKMPDKAFDLAIVDPPYGASDAIGISNGGGHCANRKEYKQFENVMPNELYFKELSRVAKNTIVWGGNFFGISGGVIAWNKHGTAFGEGEIAICSTHKSVRFFDFTWNGMIQQNMKNKEHRIHPTQKPVQLYAWLLKNYAEVGNRILDTHLGSGSIAIACYDMGYDLVGYEIDKDYYDAAVKRLDNHKKQLTLF